MTENSYIPFHVPSIGEQELAAVQRVLQSGWLTTGSVCLDFEKEFAAYVGSKHAIAVNSGTAALQLALDAIGLNSGDEVLVPTYTFTATAEVVTYFGAKPVLCDSLPGGFNIDLADAERKITARTRAIVPVHIAGEPCDLAAVHELARRYNLRVIEDAAHALPAACGGRRVGAISELTAFSFYATKTITTGEGGMLTTNEDGYAERAAMMRLHGIGKNDAWKRYSRTGSWEYEVLRAGYKFNLPDVLAAIGLAQLRKCDQLWQQRCELAQAYRSRLSQVEEIELPPLGPEGSSHSWHLFIIRLKNGALDLGRNEFIEKLKEAGIGTSVHFIPLHRHPYYREHCHCQPADFPHAEDAFSRCLSLPIYPGLSDQQVAAVVNTISRIVVEHRRRSIFASA